MYKSMSHNDEAAMAKGADVVATLVKEKNAAGPSMVLDPTAVPPPGPRPRSSGPANVTNNYYNRGLYGAPWHPFYGPVLIAQRPPYIVSGAPVIRATAITRKASPRARGGSRGGPKPKRRKAGPKKKSAAKAKAKPRRKRAPKKSA